MSNARALSPKPLSMCSDLTSGLSWSVRRRNTGERISLATRWDDAHLPHSLCTQLLARHQPAALLVIPSSLYPALASCQITVSSGPEPTEKTVTSKVFEMQLDTYKQAIWCPSSGEEDEFMLSSRLSLILQSHTFLNKFCHTERKEICKMQHLES